MKLSKLLLSILAILILCSCSQEEILLDSYNDNLKQDADIEEEFVFEEAQIEPLKYKEQFRSLPTDNTQDWLADQNELKDLGHTYWFKGEELIERELMKPIVNIRTLVQDPLLEGNVSISSLKRVEVQTQAFRDFMHTRTENRRYKKVNGGFKFSLLNLVDIFDFTSSYEKTFYKQTKYSNTALLGEANVLVYDKSVSLSNSLEARAGIIERHLYPQFIRSLYNSPIGEISTSYGPLVLRKYGLGGKLSAKYLYKCAEYRRLDSVYSAFSMGLNLTFSPAKSKSNNGTNRSITPSGSLNYNRNNFDGVYQESDREKLYTSISTIGGAPNLQVNLPVLRKDDLPSEINVSDWVRSLSDTKTHTIIDIQDDGLAPISDFILERNFRQRIMDIYKGVLEPNMQNDVARIEVSKIFVRYDETSGAPLCDIALVLHTRNGDKLILTQLNESASDEELLLNNQKGQYVSKGRKLVSSVKEVFKGLKKSGKPNKILYPYLRTNLCSNAIVDFSRIKKYKNPKTKVVYLYDDVSKVAFSYYQGGVGDKDLEQEYGLTDFVSALPEKEVSIMNLLQNYTVLGL